MAWDYSEKTKQLFMDAVHGKPGTHLGEIEIPDGIGEHGSLACGDSMRFSFRVKQHPDDPTKDVITEAKYLTFGCTSAIAASEALCTIIEDGEYTPITALSISNQDIVEFLGGLPMQKIHCSVMGAEALESAVFNWAQKREVDLEALGIDIHASEEDEGRMVCKCFSVTEPYLERKIKELNLRTIPEITNAIKAGGGCMACHHTPGGLQDILDDTWGKDPNCLRILPDIPAFAGKPLLEPIDMTERAPVLSPYQFAKQVEKTTEEYIRPMLQKDGGDMEIVDIKGNMVYCRLNGTCVGCANADQTMKIMVEQTLKDRVDERIKVVAV